MTLNELISHFRDALNILDWDSNLEIKNNAIYNHNFFVRKLAGNFTAYDINGKIIAQRSDPKQFIFETCAALARINVKEKLGV